MQTIIFDIDGTLADGTHRQHYVTGGNRQWDKYFEECHLDLPMGRIIRLTRIFSIVGYNIVLVSGRSDVVKEKTIAWMAKHNVVYNELCMRRAGDYRKDHIIKEEILNGLIARGHLIEYVIDDRPSVVEMWRRRGLTCLQCASYEELAVLRDAPGMLTLLVGPSGAGKTTFCNSPEGAALGVLPSKVISSDNLRAELCGDFRDQSKNEQVFRALHALVVARLRAGLDCVVDATNIKRADRISLVELAQGGPVRYVVLDRPMTEKIRDGGWRLELPIDLLQKHQITFNSQLKDILKGDNKPNVTVIDRRKFA